MNQPDDVKISIKRHKDGKYSYMTYVNDTVLYSDIGFETASRAVSVAASQFMMSQATRDLSYQVSATEYLQ